MNALKVFCLGLGLYVAVLGSLLFSASAFARMDPGGDYFHPRQSPSPAAPKLTPEQILAGIYQPWTGPIAEMGKALDPARDYVVWVHVPAQHPMDLRSAETFHQWALATPVTELTISHNMIAFRCRKSDGSTAMGATGMTGASKLQDAKYLLAGGGVSVFFAVYTDGHLNPESEVDAYVTKNLAKRGAIFGAFEVTPGECDAMQSFLSDFVHAPNRPFERFTSAGDPEKFEGGGCVTFASALMKKANILTSVIPRFYRDFYAPRYLMGGNLAGQADVEQPATPWLQGKRRPISFNLLWESNWDYDTPDFPGFVHLRQIDPEKMVYALKQFGAAGGYASGPLASRTVVDAQLVPDDGGRYIMQYSRTPIDDSFDDGMKEVGAVARSWFADRMAAGYRVRVGQAVGMPVLMLEKK